MLTSEYGSSFLTSYPGLEAFGTYLATKDSLPSGPQSKLLGWLARRKMRSEGAVCLSDIFAEGLYCSFKA